MSGALAVLWRGLKKNNEGLQDTLPDAQKDKEVASFTFAKYYEVIDRHALDGCDLSDVIMICNHVGKVVARLRNKTLVLTIMDRNLDREANLSSPAARKPAADVSQEYLAVGRRAIRTKSKAYHTQIKKKSVS